MVEGWRRALRAPALVGGAFVLTALTAFPMAWATHTPVEALLGPSLARERVRQGWPPAWAGAALAETPDGVDPLVRQVLDSGGALAILDGILDTDRMPLSLAGVLLAYGLAWLGLSGGVLDRLARGRPVGASAFFGACGGLFPPLLRLAACALALYAPLLMALRLLLAGAVPDPGGASPAAESGGVAIGSMVAAAVVLAAVTIVTDFAAVRLTVEGRRSAIGALGAGVRFVRRRLGRVALLYALSAVAHLGIGWVWLRAAQAATSPLWAAVLAGHLYLVLRIWARLGIIGSAVAFFQAELAQAPYAPAPDPVWPDSPAVAPVRANRGPGGT